MASHAFAKMFHASKKYVGQGKVSEQVQETSPTPMPDATANGLKVLQPGTNPDIDIVAIHGLNGHREKTWTAANGVLWLRDMLPQTLPNARIMTWGYDSRTHGTSPISAQYLHDHADTLVSDLCLTRQLSSTQKRPILFVAHSLGGLVLKSALVHSAAAKAGAQEGNRAIYLSTYGIIFAGTPHQGGEGVSWAQRLMTVASAFIQTNDRMLSHLQRDSEEVQRLMRDFAPISGDFDTKFAYETLPTVLATGSSIMIVPKASAAIPALANVEAIAIHKSHSDMLKFGDDEDDDYKTLSGHLSLMTGNAKTSIETRWNEIGPKNITTPAQSFIQAAANWYHLDTATRKQTLINMGGEHRRSTQTWTALHTAAQQNDINGITSYISNGGEVDVRDGKDATPLSTAASLGNAKAARALLEAGANVNHQDRLSETPLSKAAERGSGELVSMLIEHKADLELTNPKVNYTPLVKAALKNHTEAVKRLLAAGANVNVRTFNGYTALLWSLTHQNRAMATMILSHGPDVTPTENKHNWSALHLAARAGFGDLCARILDLGADIEATDTFGNTPLQTALVHEELDPIDVLLSHGADQHHQANDGQSPADRIKLILAGRTSNHKLYERLPAMVAKYRNK